MIQLFTNMIHPIGIRMITLQQNQNNVGVIRFITFRPTLKKQPEWRRGVIYHVPPFHRNQRVSRRKGVIHHVPKS